MSLEPPQIVLPQEASANLVSAVSVSGHAHYWNFRCRRLAAHLFLGQVLEFLGPAVLAGGFAAACLILLTRLRILPGTFDGGVAWLPVAGAVAGALVAAAWRGWPNSRDVRVRLEEAYQLHNQLSAASEGAIAYPPPPGVAGGPANTVRVVAWRWSQVLPLPAASLALLALALWLPVQPPALARSGISQKPPPLERLEEVVKQLESARSVDERALEELRGQVEQLAGREPETWYTHAGLEAAESLLQKTESGLSELASHMSAAATALDQMAGAGEGSANASETAAGLQAALHGVEHGRMPGAADVTQRLHDATGRQLDPSTARQLADALRKNADALSRLAEGGATRQMQVTELGEGSSPGHPGGLQPGEGGVDRGPGTAPLTIAQNPSTAEPGTEGALNGFDPARAALGDAAGQSIGQHEINRDAAEAPAAGGAVAQPGSGGETAWTQPLTPEERRAVKRTFE